MAPPLDPELLSILVCPLTKLAVVEQGDWLVCEEADPPRRYPVREGIPVMLIEEAEVQAPDGSWQKQS
ncbi:MAG: Trm112 family protein [Planctomycetota bacterium]|jgi:uncharacterized protein YbaR (Trm112 family)